MTRVRPAAVAGHFYPARAVELRATIEDLCAAVTIYTPAPKAIIAPHAGYIYSGAVAASAYKSVAALSGKITRVVLVGPSHRAGFYGLAAPEVDAFETPLGRVAIEHPTLEDLTALPWVERADRFHTAEHSLEVHVPFLQVTLDDFTLVPLLVGDATVEQVAATIKRAWNGADTLVVVSSDLSHYLDYASAKTLDAATTRAIEALRWEDLSYAQACGCRPIQGLLMAAKGYDLDCQTIDVRNSGDTAGAKDRVVGYGAYSFARA